MKSVPSWASVDWTRFLLLPFLGMTLYRMSAEVIHQVEEALDEDEKEILLFCAETLLQMWFHLMSGTFWIF